jgi:hypothetical protein
MYNFLYKILIAGFLDGIAQGRRLKYGYRSKRIHRLSDNSKFIKNRIK